MQDGNFVSESRVIGDVVTVVLSSSTGWTDGADKLAGE
jgi:hypothetical protein